ncbi:MAG: hypothetical protein HY512_01185 [Candidatus Aenigmarchaeota archaeon]|nr:hypothetical protein [Candidatus Aenigmarchaeota archaeon]
MIDSKYDQTAERLWEKLEFHRGSFRWSPRLLDFGMPSDVFFRDNPEALKLVDETMEEFDYGMSVFQCSWAVRNVYKYHVLGEGAFAIERYAQNKGRKLEARV